MNLILKVTFIFLISFSSFSQDQQLTIKSKDYGHLDQAWDATKGVVSNLSTTPCDIISCGLDAIIGNTYSAYDTKSKKEKEENAVLAQEGTGCYSKEIMSISEDKYNEMKTLSLKLRGYSCKCEAWGTCPKVVCPCDKLCPNNFSILKRKELKNLSNYENSFSFRNFGGSGYCWGHASLTQKFNRLAFFDEKKKLPKELIINANDSDDEKRDKNEELVEYYEDIIEKIADNEAVTIPGYKNLQDFSKDYKELLRKEIRDEWSERAMSWSGAGVGLHSWGEDGEDRVDFAKDIKSRLDNNMQPLIVFTSKGNTFTTHALLVTEYKEDKNGNITLCIRDNNKYPSSNSNCSNRMTIDPKSGKMVYNAWSGEIGGAIIGHTNDSEAISQVKSLRKKCMDDVGCEKAWYSSTYE
jgi:DNA-directed RNA polymerase subunit N (RpoN/RPB10)